MVSKASPSENLAWWSRAAQARRVAGMLSPRDAQLAETFAVECENQAREASVGCARSERSTSLPYTQPEGAVLMREAPVLLPRPPIERHGYSRLRARSISLSRRS